MTYSSILGSSDFFGLNHYTTRLVSFYGEDDKERQGAYGEHTPVKEETHPSWKR